MLGDWVSWTHDSEKRNSRVSSIHKNAIFLDECPQRFMWYEIEPVPLTEEILKANGLNDCSMFYDGWNFELTNKKMVVSVGVIWFVHELQHALRLCGLNDLADSFKVE